MIVPDPQTVRELATEHILDSGRQVDDIGADVLGHFGPDALSKHEYGAWCSAIREAIRTATITVSWPDDQPDADPAYRRWLTRNLAAAYDAGWATHADLVTGTLATLGGDKRRSCARAWVEERLADLNTDETPNCECGCVPGQPCICTLNDCECAGDDKHPCSVCDADDTEHQPGGEAL